MTSLCSVVLSNVLQPSWALEVEWSNQYYEKPSDLKSLHKFCDENNLNSPIVTTIDKEKIKNIKD